ncbi:hypothetical protein SAMN05660748_1239 [Blastococcus aggregatus]|uniref:Uncharacterized protein n=1 Tax=Blastococcus aggregatus TaxID=38502 RepID=A0A285V3F1_9ACTN|nr:hypothetical protein [Blastococcus aggregatus]SOC48543.1 hypothetical protein SAMN05660748_1239 [Blastococcus aggregatus]
MPHWRGGTAQKILADHIETYSMQSGSAGRRDRLRAAAREYATPAVPAALVWIFGVRPQAVAELIAGLAALTALLFALLILVWQQGIQIRNDPRWRTTDPVVTMVDDLRANLTYSSALSLCLVAGLVVAAATAPQAPEGQPDPGLSLWWAVPLTWLAAHLVVVLMGILRRLRSTYLELTT